MVYFLPQTREIHMNAFWVFSKMATHFKALSIIQDGDHVKIPTLGKYVTVKFTWVARPPPPPLLLGLDTDKCITAVARICGLQNILSCLEYACLLSIAHCCWILHYLLLLVHLTGIGCGL